MHGFCLKIRQNFVGAEFFLTFLGDKPQWGELKLFGGSNICYYIFIISFRYKQPTPNKVKCLFYEFLQEIWMHQELLVADILKFTKKVI